MVERSNDKSDYGFNFRFLLGNLYFLSELYSTDFGSNDGNSKSNTPSTNDWGKRSVNLL